MTMPAGQSTERLKMAAGAVNGFACDVYRRVAQKEGNLFFSPYSIHSILSFAWAGAAGRTATQMGEVLHWPAEAQLDWAARASAEFRRECFLVANALWAMTGYAFHHRFIHEISEAHQAHVGDVDFVDDPEGACATINGWVAGQTRGRIRDLMDPQMVHERMRLVLTNAVYFNDSWLHKFDPACTRDAAFFLPDDRETTVAMMYQARRLRAMEAEGFLGVELPYSQPGISMQVYVPDAVGDLGAIEEALLSTGPDALGRKMVQRDVMLWLPRFRVDETLNLKRTLVGMGMSDAFEESSADFSGMTLRPGLFISGAIHRAYVDVNEERTEAAAATAAMWNVRGGGEREYEPLVIRVDRPFLFTICGEAEGASGERVVLFMGRVMCPGYETVDRAAGRQSARRGRG